MKPGKKIAKHTERRQKSFESLKNPRGFKKPGSQNRHKQL